MKIKMGLLHLSATPTHTLHTTRTQPHSGSHARTRPPPSAVYCATPNSPPPVRIILVFYAVTPSSQRQTQRMIMIGILMI